MCLRDRNDVRSTSGLTRHINACKILITLLRHQLSTLALILKYNIINYSDLPSDNFGEDINPGASNNDEKEIRLVNTMENDNKNSKHMDIDQQKPITPN